MYLCFVVIFITVLRPQLLKSWIKHYPPGPSCSKGGNAIHWINLYSVDNAIDFPNTYLLESDLSCG